MNSVLPPSYELTRMALSAAARIGSVVPERIAPLADPPAGSGLKPVMGDYGLPLVGHTFDGMNDLLGWGQKRYDRFGALSWRGMLGTPAVLAPAFPLERPGGLRTADALRHRPDAIGRSADPPRAALAALATGAETHQDASRQWILSLLLRSAKETHRNRAGGRSGVRF